MRLGRPLRYSLLLSVRFLAFFFSPSSLNLSSCLLSVLSCIVLCVSWVRIARAFSLSSFLSLILNFFLFSVLSWFGIARALTLSRSITQVLVLYGVRASTAAVMKGPTTKPKKSEQYRPDKPIPGPGHYVVVDKPSVPMGSIAPEHKPRKASDCHPIHVALALSCSHALSCSLLLSLLLSLSCSLIHSHSQHRSRLVSSLSFGVCRLILVPSHH